MVSAMNTDSTFSTAISMQSIASGVNMSPEMPSEPAGIIGPEHSHCRFQTKRELVMYCLMIGSPSCRGPFRPIVGAERKFAFRIECGIQSKSFA